MKQSRSKIIIEDYKKNFIYKKNETNLNIQFNRVAFIFFIFFIIYLIFTIHLIHLGTRKSKIDKIENIPVTFDKLYRADITDINGNYLAKTVKSIDIGIKTSDVIDKKKLLLSLKIIFPIKDFSLIEKKLNQKKYFYLERKISEENYENIKISLGLKTIMKLKKSSERNIMLSRQEV